MDTNMTFRMDSEVKAQMSSICAQLGMTPSTAFNLFANAFVRAKGMPFPVTIREPEPAVTQEKMLADADEMLARAEDVCWAEYVYLFRNGKWYVNTTTRPAEWRLVEDVLKKQ